MHDRKVTKYLAKIKILRQYRIPVGDPSGTLSTVALKNQIIRRMYTTLMTHGCKYDVMELGVVKLPSCLSLSMTRIVPSKNMYSIGI